jgi:hypothetical protein
MMDYFDREFYQAGVQAEKRRKQAVIDVFEAEFKRLEDSSLPQEVKQLYKKRLIKMMQQKLEGFNC